jgi:Holliday junction resolvase RusA-like endonuclease
MLVKMFEIEDGKWKVTYPDGDNILEQIFDTNEDAATFFYHQCTLLN